MSYRLARRRQSNYRPMVGFLLIAAFGLLFVGCSGPDPDEVAFTEDDLVKSVELEDAGDAASLPADELTLEPLDSASGAVSSVQVFDLALIETNKAIRSGPSSDGQDVYQVTNEFLNIRAQPNITSATVERLDRGAIVRVESFVDAAWAKVTTSSGNEGFVAQRYIAKIVSEEQLAAEKKKYEGQYFVDFGFVNVRRSADAQSEKLGELPGQTIVRPISMDQTWARVPFEGKEGYVAVQYLSPFLPNFLVRQQTYALPVLHYNLAKEGSLDSLVLHIARLQQEGMKIMNFRDFRDLLLKQQEQDVRLDPKSVVIGISGVTAQNVRAISEAVAGKARLTLFIRTGDIGMNGITEKMLLTLLANGFDLQSGGHTGDDMRSLTNAQLELELQQSRRLLEEETRQPVFAVLYPQGGVNDRVMEKASAAGYLLGVGAAPERSFTREQMLRMPSFEISPGLSTEDVVKLAKGS